MAFTVAALAVDPGDDLYYDDDFRVVLETHMNILRNINATVEIIANDLVYQYEGNFFAYLINEKGVPAYLHWLYLRVNRMTNPNQFGKTMRDPLQQLVVETLIAPNPSVIENIRALYLTKK